MKQLYQEYLHLRHTANHQERLKVKADLARMVTEGEGQWLLDRYDHEVPVYNQRYIEIASRVSDGNSIPNRREPSLAESVLATKELLVDYKEAKEVLLPRVRALIKVGSSSWADNFDVRRGPSNPSDLDLEVTVDEIPTDFNGALGGMEQGLSIFKELYEKGEADYFSHSYKREDRPISVHFMPTKVFEKNCNTDYTQIKEEVLLREFRMRQKSKPPVYDERYNGHGKEYVFHAFPAKRDVGQITQVPVMMIGDYGELVMGLVMSKYFTYPTVLGDEEFFNENIAKFKENIAQRIQVEGGHFHNLPARRKRMPYYLLERLDVEQKSYVHA